MKWLSLTLICVLLGLPTAILAQTQTIGHHYQGTPETDINVGIFASISPNCMAAPLPVIVLITPPAHGNVTFKKGRLRATNLKQCLGTELPAFAVIYRSAAGFIGEDMFTLEVINPGGKSQFQRITVTVRKPGGKFERMRA
jgi:hypothetical protein